MIDNIRSKYIDYRNKNFMESLSDDVISRHLNVLNEIVGGEDSEILERLCSIYDRMPRLEEGLHELEGKDEYREILNDIYLNWRRLYELSVPLDPGLTSVTSRALAHCAFDLNIKERGLG